MTPVRSGSETTTPPAATPNVDDYDYDAAGQRIRMLDGTGTSSYAYDAIDRLTSATDASRAPAALRL